MQIAPLLHVGRGVTAIIGGGGKTTLMETLAGELSKKGKVIITTTTHIRRPEQYETLLDATEAAVSAALERSGIVCVASQAESGKLCAPWLSMGTLAPLKAHASHEPVIPEEAQRVIMVIGIDGVGKTIRETCHRSALYAQFAGVDEETVVTPQLAARVVNAEGYGDRVYINKVESAADYEAAQAMANEFSCPVIAGSLHQGDRSRPPDGHPPHGGVFRCHRPRRDNGRGPARRARGECRGGEEAAARGCAACFS